MYLYNIGWCEEKKNHKRVLFKYFCKRFFSFLSFVDSFALTLIKSNKVPLIVHHLSRILGIVVRQNILASFVHCVHTIIMSAMLTSCLFNRIQTGKLQKKAANAMCHATHIPSEFECQFYTFLRLCLHHMKFSQSHTQTNTLTYANNARRWCDFIASFQHSHMFRTLLYSSLKRTHTFSCLFICCWFFFSTSPSTVH